MKDLIRMKTSLKEEVEDLLNEQIRMEATSSSIYLAMASWCEVNGFERSADYFYEQSEEERAHMLKIFKYVNDCGGKAYSPDVTGLPHEFDSFRAVFEHALEQEIATTLSINKIMDKCYKLHDHATANFLQWFIAEQVEEEFTARRILQLFDVIGEEGTGRYHIDKRIGEITKKD